MRSLSGLDPALDSFKASGEANYSNPDELIELDFWHYIQQACKY